MDNNNNIENDKLLCSLVGIPRMLEMPSGDGSFTPCYYNGIVEVDMQSWYSDLNLQRLVWKITNDKYINLPLPNGFQLKNIGSSKNNQWLAWIISGYNVNNLCITHDKWDAIFIINDVSAMCFEGNILYYIRNDQIYSRNYDLHGQEELVFDSFAHDIRVISVNNRGDIVVCTDNNFYFCRNNDRIKMFNVPTDMQTNYLIQDICLLPAHDDNKKVLYAHIKNNSNNVSNVLLYYITLINSELRIDTIIKIPRNFQTIIQKMAAPSGKHFVFVEKVTNYYYKTLYYVVTIEDSSYKMIKSYHECKILCEDATQVIECEKHPLILRYCERSLYAIEQHVADVKEYLKKTSPSNIALLRRIANNNEFSIKLNPNDFLLYSSMPDRLKQIIAVKKMISF